MPFQTFQLRVIARCLIAWTTMIGAWAAGSQTPPGRSALLDAKNALTRSNYAGDLDGLARAIGDLDRLSHAESVAGLAHYYAGYGHFVLALMVGPGGLLSTPDPNQMQRHVEEAIRNLEASSRRNRSADASALLAHCYLMKLRSDPRRHAATLSPLAGRSLSEALERAPENPRVVLIDAMRLFWAPSQSGGDRDQGLARWHLALDLFARASRSQPEPDPSLPDWGHAEAWAWLAAAYLAVDAADSTRAQAAAERALELQPDFAWVRKSLLPRISSRKGPG